jgi:hypothetical protein
VAFTAFAFTLPPLIGTPLYAGLLTAAVIPMLIMFIHRDRRVDFASPTFLFGCLLVFYIGISFLGLLRQEGRLFSYAQIFSQAAGLLLILILAEPFSRSLEYVFLPKPRWKTIIFISVPILISVILFRREDVLLNGIFYGIIAPTMLGHFVYFLVVIHLVRRPIARAFLLVLPIPALGAMSNVLIQLSFAVVCLSSSYKALIVAVLTAFVVFIFAVAFPLPIVLEMIHNDSNTMVRSALWSRAIPAVISHPLGIGFGNSYTTVYEMGAHYVKNAYSWDYRRSLVVANHSSLLDTMLRLGWVGLPLLLWLFWRDGRNALAGPKRLSSTAIMIMLIVAGSVNPAVESVRSALFFAFGLGYLRAAGRLTNKGRRREKWPSQINGEANPLPSV